MIKELKFRKQAPQTASREDLAALEAGLGVALPTTFHEFCSRWNGGFLSDTNIFCPVPSSFREFFEEYGSETLGVVTDVLCGATEVSQFSLARKYALLNEYGNLGIIPIASDLLGNQVVLRADSPSGLVYWRDHELWEPPDHVQPGPHYAERPLLMPIANDLESFYNALTADPDA
jgi:hypothetical protein